MPDQMAKGLQMMWRLTLSVSKTPSVLGDEEGGVLLEVKMWGRGMGMGQCRGKVRLATMHRVG